MMYSERERIIQVLSNLLHNAMKFTESGEIRLGCSLKGTEEVCFVVSDTGIGIPKEEQKKIFSRFIKLDREMQGTGLGLTLSQTIIQIWVEILNLIRKLTGDLLSALCCHG